VQESGGRNSAGTRIRHRQTKFRPGSRRIPAKPVGSGWIRVLIRPDLEDSGLNPAVLAGSGQTFSLESGNGDWTLPDSGDNYQTLIFSFRNFFVRTKHRKIFSRKLFFLKMISLKSFYVETNEVLPQTFSSTNTLKCNYKLSVWKPYHEVMRFLCLCFYCILSHPKLV